MDPLGFEQHNHSTCIAEGLGAVERYCTEHRLHFTPVRRRVLEILLERHRAMGAYEILAILRDEGLGTQPPVAYRALEFLQSHGFAHRIERLNAFVACTHPGEPHAPAFLICRVCSDVAETWSDQGETVVGKSARAAGFHIESTVVEAEGVCPNCQDAAATT